MKTFRDHLIKESILDPVKNKLEPAVWANEKLKQNVKKEIIDKFNKWLKNFTDLTAKEFYFLGSTTGYQYAKDSDLDINVVIPGLSDAKKNELFKILPNGNNLTGTEHPINYYIGSEKPSFKDVGPVYDINDDKWIIKPSVEEGVNKNFKAVSEISRFFVSGVNIAIQEYEQDVRTYETYKEILDNTKNESEKKEIELFLKLKLEEIINDLDGIYIAKHMLRSLRKEAFGEIKNPDGDIEVYTEIKVNNKNTSINNLIYKYSEKLGMFSRIEKIMDEGKKWKELRDKNNG